MIRKIALTLLALFGATDAYADDFWCDTSVTIVGQDSSGNVWLGLDAANAWRTLFVCNMPTDKETCQGMMSLILAAKGTNKHLVMRVMGNVGATSCSTIPTEWTTGIRPSYLSIAQ